MPTPAGSGMTRRSMLLGGAGMFLTVYGADKLGLDAFESGIAEAATGPAQAVIVTIFLAGGIDGMSVLAPVADPGYQAMRTSTKLDDTTTDAAHRLRRAALAQEGRRAEGPARRRARSRSSPRSPTTIPNQSHFTSRHFYEVGALDPAGTTGWLGPLARHRRRRQQPDPGPQPRRPAVADAREHAASPSPRSTRRAATTSRARASATPASRAR